MSISRRTFLRITGGGAALLGAAAVLGTSTADAVVDPRTDGDLVVPTMCEMCFWKCGVLAHVRGGRVTKIVGNPAHPLSRGRICPRGIGGVGLLYDPDRLRTPLVRTRKRGEQVFEAVSWDHALDRVAQHLDGIRSRYGPEALALFTHGHGGTWFQHLAAAFGTPNVAMPSYAQCRGPRDAGFSLVFGEGVGSPERTHLREARCITLIGSHLGENMHNTQVQDFAEALDRGASLIVVDPRYSVAAGKATHWLPIKPGTDTALLLAWMHVILDENRQDTEYLARYASGLDALKAHVKDKTPEWAYTRTGIRPEVIRETARVIAGARPASIVHPGRHVTWYGNDTQRSRAIAMLNALLGSWGRRGGFSLPGKRVVKPYPTPAYPEPRRPAADAPKGTAWPFADEPSASGIRDASLPGTADYDVKAWMVYGTNLIQSLPEPSKTLQALQALDFVVAVDVLPAEITGWADVVLPESTYLERFDDVHNPAYLEPYVALRQPVVASQHESRPGWWIAQQLARRLGLQEWFPWTDVEDYLERRLGADLPGLKERGVLGGSPAASFLEDGVQPGARFDLSAAKVPLPDYEPPEEPPPGTFRLLFGRSPVHTFGRTTNNRFLSEICADNEVWLNARAARELGLEDGQRVVLVNQDDVRSEPVRLRVTQRIRGDCVYMIHGYGHDSQGLRFARGRGASDSRLVTRQRTDPLTGATGMNVNFVKVEPA